MPSQPQFARVVNADQAPNMPAERPPEVADRVGVWHWIAGFILFFFASSPSILLITPASAENGRMGSTSLTFYVLAMICYTLAALGIGLRMNWRIVPLLRAWPVWIMVLFAFISCLWSVSPSFTLSRAFAFFGTTLAAGLLATFPQNRQLALITYAGGATLLSSLLLAAVMPSLGMMDYYGTPVLRGVFVHKNNLGWVACLIFIFAWGAYQARATGRVAALAVMLLSIATMVLSKSSSSIIGTCLAAVILPTLGLIRMAGRVRPLIVFNLILLLIVIALFGPAIVSAVLESANKTVTLSGRIPMWEALIPAIQQRPLLGWGFGGAIWDAPDGADFLKYVFFAGNSQGGHIENVLNIGIIGCLIFYSTYLFSTFRGFVSGSRGDDFGATSSTFLTVLLFIGIAAPIFLGVNQLPWILISLSFFSMRKPNILE